MHIRIEHGDAFSQLDKGGDEGDIVGVVQLSDKSQDQTIMVLKDSGSIGGKGSGGDYSSAGQKYVGVKAQSGVHGLQGREIGS